MTRPHFWDIFLAVLLLVMVAVIAIGVRRLLRGEGAR